MKVVIPDEYKDFFDLELFEKFGAFISNAPKGLESAARIVKANQQRGMRTYVNINNHYEGSAPLTMAFLIRSLDVIFF